jgi:hypothetical protein
MTLPEIFRGVVALRLMSDGEVTRLENARMEREAEREQLWRTTIEGGARPRQPAPC